MNVTEEHDARNAQGVNEDFVGAGLARPASPSAKTLETILKARF
jgi:hypothetical protein